MTLTRHCSRAWSHGAIYCLLMVCAVTLLAQVKPPATPLNQREAFLKRFQDSSFSMDMVDEAVAAELSEEIKPLLRHTFAADPEVLSRVKAAAVLCRLKDADPRYWKYLDQLGNHILDEAQTAPNFESKPNDPAMIEAVRSWAATHQWSESDAASYLLLKWPAVFLQIAFTHEPASVPLLKRALQSDHDLIKTAAGTALADLREPSAINDLIDACQHSDSFVAEVLAEGLVNFRDSPVAQAVARKYLSAERYNNLRERRDQDGAPLLGRVR